MIVFRAAGTRRRTAEAAQRTVKDLLREALWLPQPSLALILAVRRPARKCPTMIERAPLASTLLTRRVPMATVTTDRSEVLKVSLTLRRPASARSRVSRGLLVSGTPTTTLAFISGWRSHTSAKLPACSNRCALVIPGPVMPES